MDMYVFFMDAQPSQLINGIPVNQQAGYPTHCYVHPVVYPARTIWVQR